MDAAAAACWQAASVSYISDIKGLYVSAIKKSFKYGDHTVTIETGELARQADGAVLVTMSETVVLVTAVGLKKATPGRDFFPLTVNYRRRPTLRAAYPAASSSAKGVPRKRKRSPRA